MSRKRKIKPKAVPPLTKKSCCFVSYSTREPHVQLLLECIKNLFGAHYKVELTPSALASGASQREQIRNAILGCAFGIVCLDGLRPNVAFEYGILHGRDIPVILLREADAQVDVLGLLSSTVELSIGPVSLNVDVQFSDIKDLNYATWSRYSAAQTLRVLWDE